MSKQYKRNAMERIDGWKVEDASDTATAGAVPVAYTFSLPDAATTSYDRVVDHKFEVLDIIVQKRAGAGGASDTIQAKNGATALSGTISINIADQTMARAGTIDDAQSTISAGGTLRITNTKVSAANVACLVTVLGVRRA